MRYFYKKVNDAFLFWCNTHERRATHVLVKVYEDQGKRTEEHCCDPKLGGILIPCQTVDLTNIAIIEERK